MDGLNRVMLIGNLGFDPELRGAGGDRSALKLRIATTESYWDKRDNTRKETTSWHNAVVFGRRGEALLPLLRKGSRIYVEGKLRTSSYDKDGQKVWTTSVVVDKLLFMGPRPQSGEFDDDSVERSQRQQRQQSIPSGGAARGFAEQPRDGGDDFDTGFGGFSDADDDIPF